MTTETMSIHKLLTELKTLDDRILKTIKVDEKIQAISDEMEAFMSEVDAALSTSNALTMVTVEY